MNSEEQHGVADELSGSEHALGEGSGVGHCHGGGDRGRGGRGQGGSGRGGSSLGRVGASEGGPGEEGGESSEDTVFFEAAVVLRRVPSSIVSVREGYENIHSEGGIYFKDFISLPGEGRREDTQVFEPPS